jgi:hypothetical protein
MLIVRDAVHAWARSTEELFVLSAQFFCEPKPTLKKNKRFKKYFKKTLICSFLTILVQNIAVLLSKGN